MFSSEKAAQAVPYNGRYYLAEDPINDDFTQSG
jgi:hypothetical protein